MKLQITGKIDYIGDVVSIPSKDGTRTFYKRELWIDATLFDRYTGERSKYENFPAFEFSGEHNCKLLDGLSIGDVVTVSFTLQGNKYADRVTGQVKNFTKIQGYAIDKVEHQQSPLQDYNAPLDYPQLDNPLAF